MRPHAQRTPSDAAAESVGVTPGSRALTLEELESVIDVTSASRKPLLVHSEVLADDETTIPLGALLVAV